MSSEQGYQDASRATILEQIQSIADSFQSPVLTSDVPKNVYNARAVLNFATHHGLTTDAEISAAVQDPLGLKITDITSASEEQ